MRQRDRMYEDTGIDGIVIVRERLKGITWGDVVCIIVYARVTQSQGRRSLLKKVKRATKLLRFVVCAVSLCTL